MGLDVASIITEANAKADHDISHYANLTVALDTSIFLRPFFYMQEAGSMNYIKQFVAFRALLAKHNIRCIWVLDGKRPKIKEALGKKRDEETVRAKQVVKAQQDQLQKLHDQLRAAVGKDQPVLPIAQALEQPVDDATDVKALELALARQQETYDVVRKAVFHFDPKLKHNLTQMFTLMGDIVIQAEYEADTVLAQLYHQGTVQAIFSKDSDFLAFGCERIVFEPHRAMYDNQKVKEISLTPFLQYLEVDAPTFAAAAVLAGCDYTEGGVPGVGFKTACILLKKYRTLDRVLKRQVQLRLVDEEFVPLAEEALAVFLNRTPVDVPQRTPVDGQGVQNFLRSILSAQEYELMDLGFLFKVGFNAVPVDVTNMEV